MRKNKERKHGCYYHIYLFWLDYFTIPKTSGKIECQKGVSFLFLLFTWFIMSCLNHLFIYSSWVNDESDHAVVNSGGVTTHNTQYMRVCVCVCVCSTLKMMGSRSMNNLDGETTQADPREEKTETMSNCKK